MHLFDPPSECQSSLWIPCKDRVSVDGGKERKGRRGKIRKISNPRTTQLPMPQLRTLKKWKRPGELRGCAA